MQANRENFGGQQGQPSSQVIRQVCHDGAGPVGQDQAPQRHPGSELPWDGQAGLWRAGGLHCCCMAREGAGMRPWPMGTMGGDPGGGQARPTEPVNALRTLAVAWLQMSKDSSFTRFN